MSGQPRRRTSRAAVAAGCLVGAALLLAGCASRPTEEQLATSILSAANASVDVNLTDEQANCISRQLLGSELSDTTLEGLAEDFNNPEVLETEVDDVETQIQQAALACISPQ